MELDITDFFLRCDNPQQYSASKAEYGDRAAQITWENACCDSRRSLLFKTSDEVIAVRDYFKGMGVWTEDEIVEWPLEELNAILIQDIAGAMREGNLTCNATQEDWDNYSVLAVDGQVPGNLFNTEDGRVYYNIEG